MRIEIFSNNILEVNTYFLIKDDKCLLIDPGSNDEKIISFIQKKHLNLVGVLLTHAHFDHFLSASTINLMYNVPLYVHQNALPLLYEPNKNISSYLPNIRPLILDEKVNVITLTEQDKNIDDFIFNLYHVPGHSPGSICIYFKEEQIVFTGDTLFKGSIGRTDLNGNEKQLINNIKNKLFRLPDDTIVYPGHGDKTTISYEKKHNYYIK